MTSSTPEVLLTGATGFLGTPCLDELVRRGWRVHAAGRRGGEEKDSVRWHRADLLEPGAAARLFEEIQPSHLLHAAWASGRDGFRDSPENFRWVSASLELLRLFAEAGGRRAVLVGTGAEYDWSGGVCVEDSTPLAPSSTYGLCKKAFFELSSRFLEQAPELEGAWGRLFFLYGPREDDYRLASSMILRLLRGEVAECTFDRLRRDYLFIDDVAKGLVDLLESSLTGAVNLAAGKAVSLGDLVRAAARHAGAEDLVRLGGQPSGEHPAPLVVASIDRARRELGWSPSTDLDEGMERTVAWWRRRLGESAGGGA